MASSRPLVAAGLVKEAVAPVPVGQRLLGVFRIAVGALGLGRQLHPGWFGFQHDVDALRRRRQRRVNRRGQGMHQFRPAQIVEIEGRAEALEMGRASCRGREWEYWYILVESV